MAKLVIYLNYQLVKDIIPLAGARRPDALVYLTLMLSMPAGSWWRLGLWLLCGLGYTSSTPGAPDVSGPLQQND